MFTVCKNVLMLSVQGYKQHRAFIITQGPMRTTSRDFWKMVFSRKCSVVVMLSDLSELDEVTSSLTNTPWPSICVEFV
jgi:protein tyrosine phosphatase